MLKNYKIKACHQQTSEPYLNLFTVLYGLGQKTKKWIFASRSLKPRCISDVRSSDCVCIVPILGNKLVITKQYRPSIGTYEYDLPAGVVEPNETAMDAAKRELKEETGLYFTQADVLYLSPPLCSSSGVTDETITVVFAKVSGNPNTNNQDTEEDIELIFIPFSDVALYLCHLKEGMCSIKLWMVLRLFFSVGKISL